MEQPDANIESAQAAADNALYSKKNRGLSSRTDSELVGGLSSEEDHGGQLNGFENKANISISNQVYILPGIQSSSPLSARLIFVSGKAYK